MRQRIHAVMEWAVAMGLRTDNPCNRLAPVLGPQQDLVQHMRALPHAEVAAAVKTARASAAAPVVKLALEFPVLTAVRSGDVHGAVWTEIDLADRVWTIPALRMNAKREHRVPLCERAVEILGAAWTLGDAGSGPLVFPGAGGAPLPEKRLRRLLQSNEIPAVPHGFRSSFRDWAAERTNHPREVVEAALAHTVRNKVEAAYARSDLFERRRRLMDEWAAYLDGDRRSAVAAESWREMEYLNGSRRPNPRGRHPESALTPAFVRNIARAGRYCDGRRESRASDS